MHIGLIGGIGPAAQDYYVRCLIALFNRADRPLDMTIVHADTGLLLANQVADRRRQQADVFSTLTERLARAGADCVAITSIAGHFCRDEFAALSPLPVIDMVDAVAQEIEATRLERVGILGTRTVMATHFYGGLGGATVIAPTDVELNTVPAAYVEMATTGKITTEQRDLFHAAARRMIDEAGATAIILGGTDLVLAFDTADGIPVIDCAAIHARKIAEQAMADGSA
jgi:aspartate racemase